MSSWRERSQAIDSLRPELRLLVPHALPAELVDHALVLATKHSKSNSAEQ